MRSPLFEATTLSMVTLALGVGCRDYHAPIPYDECQPYDLQCVGCLFEDEHSEVALFRMWACEEPELGVLDVVLRRAADVPADDYHYYDGATGERIGALRRYDEPREICGRTQREEWYGTMVGDCEPLCEHDATLPDADPDLPVCGGIQ